MENYSVYEYITSQMTVSIVFTIKHRQIFSYMNTNDFGLCEKATELTYLITDINNLTWCFVENY